jgi:transposase
MEDKKLYHHLLGLTEPWFVEQVNLDVKEQRVDVFVEHTEDIRFQCPECKEMYSVYDHSPKRVWRHLDSCQFMTYLHARPPRVDCPKHGVVQVHLPWAEPKARFTVLFERFAIEVLKSCDVKSGAALLRISWDEAWHIKDKAVARGLKRRKSRSKQIGIDEKTVGRGHDYVTIVSDLTKGTVIYIADDRKKESLDGYFRRRTEKSLHRIEAIATDIWDPYIASIRQYVPNSDTKLVFDRYHLMVHMIKAVDTVRKREHWKLKRVGDETLTGSKYTWLYSRENLPDKHKARFRSLKGKHLKTMRAWAIKESFRDLWNYSRPAWALRHFKSWYFWATHSRLAPVIEKAKMFRKYLIQIMTYFKHRITNAVSEGLNSKIETLRKQAYGFRNREHFKISVYFHCGGLNLSPVTHKNPG